MSGLELTPEERENWRRHNRHSKKLSDSLRGNPNLKSRSTDEKTVKKVIELYQTRGVNFISSDQHMSVDTVKTILKEAGVYE